jgi:hypothetical protein
MIKRLNRIQLYSTVIPPERHSSHYRFHPEGKRQSTEVGSIGKSRILYPHYSMITHAEHIVKRKYVCHVHDQISVH